MSGAPAWSVGFRDAVTRSPDLMRIIALPRRAPLDLTSSRAAAMVELMTARLRRPDRPPGAPCACLAELGRRHCIDRLLALQAWALYEAPLAGGLLGFLPVGSGKTALDVLMPMVMPDCRMSTLLLPPGLVEQLISEYRAIAEHFVVPSIVIPSGYSATGWMYPNRPVLHVIPYSKFSRPESTALLDDLKPDTVLADESQNLKNPESVRTGRFIRSFDARPQTRLGNWTGSPVSKSIKNVSHLAAFSLGDGSPLPLKPDVVDQWAAAVDPSDWPAPLGALKLLLEPGETDIRVALRRRIAWTRGVITANTSIAPASVVLRERKPPRIPAALRELMAKVRNSMVRPDGEELVTALEVATCVEQLICGFYYRWRFPGKPDADTVEEWFAARKAWGREMREKLKNPRPHLDSPRLLKNAAERFFEGYEGDLPTWGSDTWARWRDVKDTVPHVTEAVWVDDYLVHDAAAWAKKTRGIVWYEHSAFGHAVAEAACIPLHGGGAGAEARILAEKGDRSIAASIASHGTGRNGLQFLFAEQLVANPPKSGDAWEQLLGRLNRKGQEADEVVTHVYRHAPEYADALDRALELAKFIEGLTSNRQMLRSADCEWAISSTKV